MLEAVEPAQRELAEVQAAWSELLDKRADMRRLMGRQRVTYKLSTIELIASFRFKHRQDPEQMVDEELITRMVAEKLGIPFVILDPLKLDYQTVTSSFGAPFAERHQVIAVEETDDSLTLAVADPWDRELLGSIARVKGKPIHPVLATSHRSSGSL